MGFESIPKFSKYSTVNSGRSVPLKCRLAGLVTLMLEIYQLPEFSPQYLIFLSVISKKVFQFTSYTHDPMGLFALVAFSVWADISLFLGVNLELSCQRRG